MNLMCFKSERHEEFSNDFLFIIGDLLKINQVEHPVL